MVDRARGTDLAYTVIGLTKVASGLLLLVAAVGILRYLPGLNELGLEPYLLRLHLDPENRLVHEAVARVSGISASRLHLIGFGTFVYASLHLVEGTGLLLRKRWAEYVTVLATGLLLPVEVYEMARHLTPLKGLVFAVNLAVVAYLATRLVARRGEALASAKA